jgi:hypothetical protein
VHCIICKVDYICNSWFLFAMQGTHLENMCTKNL